jgi:hypothetical protein
MLLGGALLNSDTIRDSILGLSRNIEFSASTPRIHTVLIGDSNG